MTRLIVEEGNQRRAFQMGEGLLTIGSGPLATLKLTAPGVAEVHAELEVRGGKARLRPKPGVLPPLLEGAQVLREVELPSGATFSIGEAKLRVELPGAPAAPETAPAAAAPAVARAPVRSAGTARGGARPGRGKTAAAGRGREREAEEGTGRRLPPRKANLTPLIVAGAVLAIVGLALFLGPKILSSQTTTGSREILGVARADIAEGAYERAQGRLKAIPPAALQDPAFKQAHDAVVAEIEAARGRLKQLDEQIKGTRYWQTQLANYEERYLRSGLDRPKARVFLQRAAEFKRRWPGHEKREWVERQEARFQDLADLSQPATFDDVAFEVKVLTWTDTRDYKQAFQVLDRFMQRASGDELERARALAAEKRTEREAWYEDRLQQARYELERKDATGKSIAILVTILTQSGDPAMESRAETELLRFDRLIEWLRGYRSSMPDVYDQILQHPRIAEYVRRNDA